MNGLLHLLIGAVLFFGGHAVLSAPALRPVLVGRLGQRGFTMLYSTLATIGLVWLIYGFAVAPRQLWWGGSNLAIVPLVLMAPASLLLVGAFTQKNPTAVGQGINLSAADSRGIQRITRHPFLWAVVLWAVGHLVVNGNFPALVLFGGMLVLALFGAAGIDRRSRERDPVNWTSFAAVTSNIPFAAIVSGRNRLVWSEIGWGRVALAVPLYLVLILAHPYVIGVSPLG
jgi:uncharacterized membrane protein